MDPRGSRSKPGLPWGLGFAARNAGDGRGLPAESRKALLRLGYAEIHPYRTSTGKGAGLADVHEGLRLTREGCNAAGVPWRVGLVSLVFGDLMPRRDRSCGLTVTLSCQPDGLRVALVPVAGGILSRQGAWPQTRPEAEAEVATYAEPAEAARAFREAVARAGSLTGCPGRLVDPGYLAWDEDEFRAEDVAALDAGQGPSVDAVLDAVEALLTPGPAPRP